MEVLFNSPEAMTEENLLLREKHLHSVVSLLGKFKALSTAVGHEVRGRIKAGG